MNFEILFLALAAYGLGSISSAVFICKLFSKPDPRTHGSANPGATNVLRIAGKPYALMVLIFDVLKGALPIFVAQQLKLDLSIQTWIGCCAVLGHIFPVWMKFQGGKGVATALGLIVVLSPFVALCSLGLFLIVVLLTRWVSLGSILAASIAPVFFYLLHHNINWGLIALAVAITAKHHANIRRILRGEENKIGASKN